MGEVIKLLGKVPILEELLDIKSQTAYLVDIDEEFLFKNYELGLA